MQVLAGSTDTLHHVDFVNDYPGLCLCWCLYHLSIMIANCFKQFRLWSSYIALAVFLLSPATDISKTKQKPWIHHIFLGPQFLCLSPLYSNDSTRSLEPPRGGDSLRSESRQKRNAIRNRTDSQHRETNSRCGGVWTTQQNARKDKGQVTFQLVYKVKGPRNVRSKWSYARTNFHGFHRGCFTPVSGGAVTLLITGFPGPRCRVQTEDVLQ